MQKRRENVRKIPLPELSKRPIPQSEKDRIDRLVQPALKGLEPWWFYTEFAASAVYADFLNVEKPLRKRFFSDILSGARLIDLGAGGSKSYLAMAYFAFATGITEYVAVDSYANYQTDPNMKARIINELKRRYPNHEIDMSIVIEDADMLAFLARQHDLSASVCMNGIDDDIISSFKANALEYLKELITHIARVVPPGGIAFGANSPHLQRLEKFGFKKVSKLPDNCRVIEEFPCNNFLYQKSSI